MAFLNKITCNRIKVGVCFSEDVFFDDGENLFLGKMKPARTYHVTALERWAVPFLLCAGHEVDLTKEKVEPQPKKAKVEFESVNLGAFGLSTGDEYLSSPAASLDSADDVEELEEVEELGELEEL